MRKYVFNTVVIILLLLPLWMYLFWVLTSEKEMKILIMDKTVLNKKTQEHISLSWVLTYRKYVKEPDKLYDRFKDYYGFFPKERFDYIINDYNNYTDSMIDILADTHDMVYFTDMYGIYHIEWFEENKKYYPLSFLDDEKIAALERSRRIYGGMTQKEMDLLRKMKERRKLIITEFNAIASPTSLNVRQDFENTFYMNWSGWVGRYFSSLDTNINKEIPNWLKRNYVMQHDNTWPFTKSGIAFVRNDDHIEILENETHLELEVPIINTEEFYQNKYGLPEVMKYPFWFDIVSTLDSNNVVSEYELKPNKEGLKILNNYHIPVKFPAVLEHYEDDYLFYYLAGDYCDNPIKMNSSHFKGIQYFSWLLYEKSTEERYSFFWRFYRPLIITILDKYYEDEIKKD